MAWGNRWTRVEASQAGQADLSRYQDGLGVATSIFEAALFHQSVKVACRCGHVAYFQAHGLWWLFQQRRWSDEFRNAPDMFYCSECWTRSRREMRTEPVEPGDQTHTIQLPIPDEREWKRALKPAQVMSCTSMSFHIGHWTD
jgi:hypothetical protein